ncbi:MAG TPA: hypothetical protein VKU00_06975 [Chthonomonadaceae bacterium]|nr:hypothetical protein [Chthonomonadaceae bacterium]
MSRILALLIASLALSALCLRPSLAQTPGSHQVLQPASSRVSTTSPKKAHTCLKARQVPDPSLHRGLQPMIGTGYGGSFSPADMRGFYKIPATKKGAGDIVIVEAFDTDTLLSDFNNFSSYYGLPTENGSGNALVVHNPYGAPAGSADGTGWDLEACLDTQWAHAMAPNAVIVLVEATSDNVSDLFNAVAYARSGAAKEVVMGWALGEGAETANTESILTTGNGINFAAAGDNGAFYALSVNYASYPGSSPNVVSCGGTTTIANASGKLLSTLGWEEGGGGPSAVFSKPSYQSGIAGTDPTFRSMPDLCANADPNTPVAVWNTSFYGSSTWFFEGGTSEAAAVLAAIQNDSGNSYASTFAFLTHLYANLDTAGYYNDIKAGYNGYVAGDDFDMITGVGTPLGNGTAGIPGM